MSKSYQLTDQRIDEVVTRVSPGNYGLGYTSDSTFYVYYVGRSDDDVNDRLHKWVGKSSNYKRFKFSYATSPKAAFEKECRNYHDFGGSKELDNKNHPQRPSGASWKCPVCTIYD